MNYLVSKKYDYLWFIGPSFISCCFVLVFYFIGIAPETTSPLYWLMFVVFIDVSHVWSTLFRTYLSKEKRIKFQKELWIIPFICYGSGVLLHSIGDMIFWRVLAYLAVFHFIRQQYGFFQLYDRKEKKTKSFILLDSIMIYSATIIPLIIWHFSGLQQIHWFVEGDFLYVYYPQFIKYFIILACIILFLYLVKELLILKNKLYSPKNLLVFGTCLSWWIGIVWIKTDWAFTITNVVSHGIPYFALIYHYDIKERKKIVWWSHFPTYTIFIFLFSIGYLEEGLWDIFIWKDHISVFPFFDHVSVLSDSALLSLIVPLLTLPQAIHYILDGYIWKQN